jgi:hypothetical protein
MEAAAQTAQGAPRHGVSPERAATRWVGVGHARSSAPAAAGAEAAAQALCGRDAKLAVVFASDAYDLEALVGAIRAETGDASLIGCTTAGELSHLGPSDGGVVVTALGGPGFEVSTAIGHGAPGELREAGAAAATAMTRLDSTEHHRALMLLSDGVAGDQQEVMRGVHDIVGAGVPLVGGCAGDGMKMERTFQIHGGEVISGGVVGAAIVSDAPLGIGWSHGWERVGEPMLVTSATGNRVEEIDDRPALDHYLDSLEAPAEVRSDAREFTRWARTHPLGLGQRRTGHQPVRCVSEADFARRAIVCTAEVPAGGLTWFMNGDADSVLRSTAAACRDAVEALEGEQPLGVIAFDCIGRRGVLGDSRIDEEVGSIRGVVGDAPIAGLYTYGEIARVTGVNALHSQTFVAMAIA